MSAFKNAVASTMTGVTADSIYINTVKTMTLKRRRLEDERLEALTPTMEPTDEPSEHPTREPTDSPPTMMPIFTLYEGDDFVAPPTPEPSLKPSLAPTVNEVGTVTGIAINYNITISAKSLGFSTPQEAFDALTAELITAIDNGNFTQALRDEGTVSGLELFSEASSSVTDFAIKNYMAMGPPTPVRTKVPTGTPTSMPSHPSSSPTKQSIFVPSTPTVTVTAPITPPRRSTEIVAGVVLVGCIFGILYITSVLIGCLRRPAILEKKKAAETEKYQENYYVKPNFASHDGESKLSSGVSSASSIRSGSGSSVSIASTTGPIHEDNQVSVPQESVVRTTTTVQTTEDPVAEIESGLSRSSSPINEAPAEATESLSKKDSIEK